MFSMAVASVVLPFLPMLPTQLLLNNFLYDLAQITIPTDNVNVEILRAPHRWDIHMIRNFMICMGPVSSLFDFLTFFVLFWLFPGRRKAVSYGLVRRISCNAGNRSAGHQDARKSNSQPSEPAVAREHAHRVGSAVLLRYSGLAPWLGFVPLPVAYLAFVAVAVAIYLIFVEFVKRALVRSKFLQESGHTVPAANRVITLPL